MTITIEQINNMAAVQELLECTDTIRKESLDYAIKKKMIVDEALESYQKLETIAYERAISIATTSEELEACASSIEEKSLESLDPDGWADELRTKAYGIEWYLKREFSSPAYQGFVDFIKAEGIENPLEELEKVIAN